MVCEAFWLLFIYMHDGHCFVCRVYVATRIKDIPAECKLTHEPIDGWAWVECGDLGALLRDIARGLLGGPGEPVATPKGLVDPLELSEDTVCEPRLDGVFWIYVSGRDFGGLFELGAVRVEWRVGWRFAKAEFKGGRVSDLLARGYVPIVWNLRAVRGTPSE